MQIATDLTTAISGVAGLRSGLLGFVIVGTACVGLGGWLVARRLTTPLEQVTAATKQLTSGPELPALIENDRTDEVGQLAATFNELVASLHASRDQQIRLVADASHELRTPLTTLRVKIDFLEGEPNLDATQRAAVLAGASADLKSLSSLMSELVALAANDVPVEDHEIVNLGELVEDAARRLRLCSEREVTVSATGTTVEGRPQLLASAVNNLVNNAKKYSPPGKPIHISEQRGHISVSDRGPGIRDEDRPFVFDRFFRSPVVESGTGSGIGLAIVQQAADAHGGETWANQRPGGGAIVGFSVRTD